MAVAHAEGVMGTVVSFSVLEAKGRSEAQVKAAIGAAAKLMHRHDDIFSLWKQDSAMSRIRRGELALVDAPEEIGAVLELCEEARSLSKGFFDPFSMPGGIDPTGLVKGWSAEQALALLESQGATTAMVNAGGDIACLGRPDGGYWRIGIRHPWRASAFACLVEVESAVATSGEYERGRHLYDPIPRDSPRPVAATVVGARLALADAFATALAVGGEEVLETLAGLEGYEAYLIEADATERSTPGMRFAAAMPS